MTSGPGVEGLQVSYREEVTDFVEQGRIQLLGLSPSGPNPLEGLVKGHEAGDTGAGARTQVSSSPGSRPHLWPL